jgi:hypothetical protein
MAPPEVSDGFQDRRVRPRPFDGGGHTVSRSPTPRFGRGSAPCQQCGLSCTRRPGQQYRASPVACSDRVEQRCDGGALLLPSDEVFVHRWAGFGDPDLDEGVAKGDRFPARGHAEFAGQGPVESLELPQGAVAISSQHESPHELEMGFFVGWIEKYEVVPALQSPE